jgi:hypothetical protein
VASAVLAKKHQKQVAFADEAKISITRLILAWIIVTQYSKVGAVKPLMTIGLCVQETNSPKIMVSEDFAFRH